MPRNLSGRVEVMCRIRSEAVAQRLEEILDVYRRDDVKARLLLSDGTHRRADAALAGATGRGLRAQEFLLQRASSAATLGAARPDAA